MSTIAENSILGKVSEPSASFPKTPEEENLALRMIVEEQEIAMDMIMRKYREQIDSLIKVARLDVGKLYNKKNLDVIVDQANKINEMTKKIDKNIKIIVKYEEIMKQIECENESLRGLVARLSDPSKRMMLRAEVGRVFIDVSSQTNQQGVTEEYKSMGTSLDDSGVRLPDKQNKSTEMVHTAFSDGFAHIGTIDNTRPLAKPLDADAAFDLYVNRFSKETQKLTSESTSLANITSNAVGVFSSEAEDTEKFEDSSEGPSSSRTEGNELSSDITITSPTGNNPTAVDLFQKVGST